jgi:hypothetical protein
MCVYVCERINLQQGWPGIVAAADMLLAWISVTLYAQELRQPIYWQPLANWKPLSHAGFVTVHKCTFARLFVHFLLHGA